MTQVPQPTSGPRQLLAVALSTALIASAGAAVDLKALEVERIKRR